ncbi:hypothetical protein AMECASPLE_033276 [Ameca splendens]|uniref:Uncharacterized protein n=1 Tax=Ameca splendens TaxID=208324 RepID=A0ABV0ZGI4_9TELE
MLLAGDLLPGEFVPSWCGVGGSVVGVVLGGVCPVAPVGGGWGSVARGLYLAVGALCGGGRMQRGCLEQCCVWNLHYVDMTLSVFQGFSSPVGVCPCGVGRGFMAFGAGACVQ